MICTAPRAPGAPTARRRVVALLLALAVASVLGAQEPRRDEPPSLDTQGFLFARYASGSSSVLYAGQGWGAAGVFFGAVENRESGYRELICGAMSRVASADGSLLVGLAYAEVTEGDYLQLYLVPSARLGALSLDATVEWYAPLERAGVGQLGVNPVMLLWRGRPRWAVGGSAVVAFADGAAPSSRAGPALELALPRGALQLELLAGLERADDEIRLGFVTTF